MSLTKLLGSKLSLFKKDAISFVIIRRHDLDVDTAATEGGYWTELRADHRPDGQTTLSRWLESSGPDWRGTRAYSVLWERHMASSGLIKVTDDKLRYLAVRPNASVASLRRKVWHLLELPDFCDELIVLKNQGNVEIPLTDLRRGNNPQQPFILEVWSSLPMKPQNDFSKIANMLTMGDGVSIQAAESQLSLANEPHMLEETVRQIPLKETMTLNHRPMENQTANSHYLLTKKSDLTCKISSSSMFLKLQGKKIPDNLTNVLLKIQSDLNALTNKMSNLETKFVEK